MLTLNESILNILIEILTEIPTTLQVSPLLPSSTSSLSLSLSLDQNQNQLYNQKIGTTTCSIIEKYAVLLLDLTFIDKLLDRIAVILSMELSAAGTASASSLNSTYNTNSKSITTGRKVSKRGGGGEYS